MPTVDGITVTIEIGAGYAEHDPELFVKNPDPQLGVGAFYGTQSPEKNVYPSGHN